MVKTESPLWNDSHEHPVCWAAPRCLNTTLNHAAVAKMADFEELNANLLAQNRAGHEREHAESAVCTNGTRGKFNCGQAAGEPFRERTGG